MKMYIARDKEDGELCLYNNRPSCSDSGLYFETRDGYLVIDKDLFPEVTFENSPMEVELKLIEK